MDYRKTLTLFASFLLGFSICFIASCGSGPKVTVYLSHADANGMDYYNENTDESGFIKYSDTDKFVCFNQADAQTLFNYCSLGT